MIQEITKDELLKWDFKNLKFIEPPWKLIMSNKAILPLLWEMFPNHPNFMYQTNENENNEQVLLV